jgi:hypothetical protein
VCFCCYRGVLVVFLAAHGDHPAAGLLEAPDEKIADLHPAPGGDSHLLELKLRAPQTQQAWSREREPEQKKPETEGTHTCQAKAGRAV